jgi:hypothetical protein
MWRSAATCIFLFGEFEDASFRIEKRHKRGFWIDGVAADLLEKFVRYCARHLICTRASDENEISVLTAIGNHAILEIKCGHPAPSASFVRRSVVSLESYQNLNVGLAGDLSLLSAAATHGGRQVC